MIVDLTDLINGYVESKSLELLYSFDKEYLECTNIDRLDDVQINVKITRLDDDTFSMVSYVEGDMWFSDKTHHFSLKIEEMYTNNDELSNEYIKINDNTIDILPIIWQNIVLEIPM